MEYTVHELKKKLQKNRVQIIICLLLLGFVGVVIAISYPSKRVDGIKSPTETQIITDFTIISTYKRQGGPYFTQGLIFQDASTLIESTGLYGESVIHSVKLEDMSVIKESKLDKKYFGEGCEIIELNGKKEIYQLTWREKKVLVWDADTFALKRTLDLPDPINQGWGITKDFQVDSKGNSKQWFYISNGSSKIFIVDPETLAIKESVEIKNSNGDPQMNLNELEFVNGKLWANIWGKSVIAVIEMETGLIEYLIDLSKLMSLAKQEAKSRGYVTWNSDSVLNGIAYYPPDDKLIVTGKKWPLMWQIKINGLYE